VQGPTFNVAAVGGYLGAKGANLLDVSARLHPDGKTVAVFVVNRDTQRDIPGTVHLAGSAVDSPVDLAFVTSDDLLAWNSFENPERVRIKQLQMAAQNNEVRFLFPAHSVAKLTFRLR